MLHAVIMAGGSGTRFWPESRSERPKQLLNMLGPRTMIQTTVDRLGDLVPTDRLCVATTALLADKIAEQLPDLPRGAVLVEPCKRDTAPCIGLAAAQIYCKDPDATMAVMPSDHVISTAESFQKSIKFASQLVEEQPGRMVTFGISPTYPAESFGYIERGGFLANGAYHVKSFHEKPKAGVAEKYLKAGIFYWNSGIFVWKAKTILDAIRRFQPKMARHINRIVAAMDTPEYDSVLESEFTAIDPISIDFGVMERATDVVVIEATFDWDDVGSWRALERLLPLDDSNSIVDAKRYINIKSRDVIVRNSDARHVVVTVGVDDLIVIVTPDATLVANKHDEEAIRQVTKILKERGWDEHL